MSKPKGGQSFGIILGDASICRRGIRHRGGAHTRHKRLQGAFAPEAAAAIGEAFDAAPRSFVTLALSNWCAKLLAQPIISVARRGELDPVRLRTAAISWIFVSQMSPTVSRRGAGDMAMKNGKEPRDRMWRIPWPRSCGRAALATCPWLAPSIWRARSRCQATATSSRPKIYLKIFQSSQTSTSKQRQIQRRLASK